MRDFWEGLTARDVLRELAEAALAVLIGWAFFVAALA